MVKKAVLVLALSALFYCVSPSLPKDPSFDSLRFLSILSAVPSFAGLDLMIKDFELGDDFELFLRLTNTGEKEYRKGLTLKVKILVSEKKVSDFEHLLQESLLPYSGNIYTIEPPYRIFIHGDSRVKASVWPKPVSGDVFHDNNTLEQTFRIAPFGIDPQNTREFIFSKDGISKRSFQNSGRIKVEARWDGGGRPLRLVLNTPGRLQKNHSVKGKSPLRLAVPIEHRLDRKGKDWKVMVTNLTEQKAAGHLIFQTP